MVFQLKSISQPSFLCFSCTNNRKGDVRLILIRKEMPQQQSEPVRRASVFWNLTRVPMWSRSLWRVKQVLATFPGGLGGTEQNSGCHGAWINQVSEVGVSLDCKFTDLWHGAQHISRHNMSQYVSITIIEVNPNIDLWKCNTTQFHLHQQCVLGCCCWLIPVSAKCVSNLFFPFLGILQVHTGDR